MGRRLSLPPLVLVSGNPNKAIEARRIVDGQIEVESMDLPEIQSLDLREVLEEKGREAWRRLQRPLAVEETGLSIEAFNGFPGPLVKWMLKAMGAGRMAEMALAQGEDRATARCAILYLDGQRRVYAEGRTPGRLVAPPRGEGGFGWDPVFVPEGQDLTYGELPAEVKDRIGHRGEAWRELARKLSQPAGESS